MRNQRTAAIRVTVAVIVAFTVAALATSCGSNDTPAETSTVTVTDQPVDRYFIRRHGGAVTGTHGHGQGDHGSHRHPGATEPGDDHGGDRGGGEPDDDHGGDSGPG